MKAIFKYNVLARLPESLRRLESLAFNLWFSWHHGVSEIFRRMDADLWESCKHNPVYMLRAISQERLEELSSDAGFLAQLDRVYEDGIAGGIAVLQGLKDEKGNTLSMTSFHKYN